VVQQDNVQAVFWWKKAADQDFPGAENNLGLAYLKGQGVEQNYAQGVKWIARAAEHGYAEAETNLGGAYHLGLGVAQDDVQAAVWYRKAADQGHAHAQNQLGWLYYAGGGVVKNFALAAFWWRKAAVQGNPTAQANLGDLYHLGQGVQRDDEQAAEWYAKSAMQGNAYSKEMLPLTLTGRRPNLSPPTDKRAMSPQVIAQLASGSTVLIISSDEKRRHSFLGSGFVVASHFVITNSHVVPIEGSGFVRKIGSDQSAQIGEVVSRDAANDIALLYVESLDLPSLPLAANGPVVGDTVFVMGNPEGMEGTFSEGVVSALRTSDKFNFIQITAAISRGSSGGPVLNVFGEVIGISTAMLKSGQNLNFAVPASAIDALLKQALNRLRRNSYQPTKRN
jgi:TPR repeat protein